MHDPRSPEVGPRSVSIDEPVHLLNSDHPPDLVGIKDNITVAPTDERSHGTSSAMSSADTLVRLAVKCPSLADTSMGESTVITVPYHYTIAHVKRQIERMWPGKPKAEGMRFFKSGQALNDDTLVSTIAGPTDADAPPAIHLVIRPGAWGTSPHRAARSTPGSDTNGAWSLPALSRMQRAASSRQAHVPLLPLLPPIPSIEIPRFSQRSASGTEQDRHLASVVEKMDPAQYSTFRSLLSWAYARYVDVYEEEWLRSYSSLVKNKSMSEHATMSSIDQVAREMACSVDELTVAIDSLETNVLLWGPLEDELEKGQANGGVYNYKQYVFQGLPYLLRVERNPAEERLRALQGRIDRLRNLLLQMEKLINYQTLLSRTVPTSSRSGAIGGEAMTRTPAVGAARRTAPRGTPFQRFSLLDRSDVMKVLLSSFFLTFKMAILLYVFTRGVSRVKMALMGGTSLLYILYEAWTMLERRVRARRRDLRRANGENDDGTRRGPANGATQDGGPASNAAFRRENRARDGETAMGSTSIRSPRSPNRYRVFSPFLLEFWIERAAYFNLAEEDREIGMRPAEGPRALATTARPPSAIVRAINDFAVLPVILFLVTLVPAVEQRRRRAIEQRDDLIRSTAAKVEEQERRLREALEKQQDGKSTGKMEAELTGEAAVTTSASSIRPPTVLRSRYGQQVVQRRSTGRQIDIAQEIEAAAAAAADEDANGLEQADMGFL